MFFFISKIENQNDTALPPTRTEFRCLQDGAPMIAPGGWVRRLRRLGWCCAVPCGAAGAWRGLDRWRPSTETASRPCQRRFFGEGLHLASRTHWNELGPEWGGEIKPGLKKRTKLCEIMQYNALRKCTLQIHHCDIFLRHQKIDASYNVLKPIFRDCPYIFSLPTCIFFWLIGFRPKRIKFNQSGNWPIQKYNPEMWPKTVWFFSAYYFKK